MDSVFDLPAGFVIKKEQKYRGQNVLVTVQIPVGKSVTIDETVFKKLNNVVLQFNQGKRRVKNVRSTNHNLKRYRSNTVYIMQADGSLKSSDKKESIKSGAADKKSNDSYRWDGASVMDSQSIPVAPTPPISPDEDPETVYRYNESPSENRSKEKLAKELERKQKEIEELRKKLEAQ